MTESDPLYSVEATNIAFMNQGDVPVWIGKFKLLPGDYYKFDIHPPHWISHQFDIRFEAASVAVTGLRVVAGRKLLIQMMTPQ